VESFAIFLSVMTDHHSVEGGEFEVFDIEIVEGGFTMWRFLEGAWALN
jgi:hypothetical protein